MTSPEQSSPEHRTQPENLLLNHPVTASRISPTPPLRDIETLIMPTREKAISYQEFIEQARLRPALFLRNTAGFISDALESGGSHKGYHYGREVTVFDAMSSEISTTAARQGRVPRDHEETIFNLYQVLREQAKLPHPDKAIVLVGPPGCGKNLIINRLLSLVEDFSRYHPDGARFRIAFSFSGREQMGYIRAPNGTGDGQYDDRQLIPSSSNATPFSLIGCEIEIARHAGLHTLAQKLVDERESLIASLKENSDGKFLNADYLREARIGPTLKATCLGLIQYYRKEENLSLEDSLTRIRQDHVVAQPYFFDAETGEGILTRLPLGDTVSDAWGLGAGGGNVNNPTHYLKHSSTEPIVVSSGLLRADFTNFEDLFHPGMDLRHLTYLHTAIEDGKIQIAVTDPGNNARYPHASQLITINKDMLFIGSANRENIDNRSRDEGFSPLAERIIGINTPSIRNYKAQAEALTHVLSRLPEDRKATPHAAMVASLFFTATRLIDPKPGHYTGEFKDISSLTANLKGGVAKALYLAIEPGKNEEHILNFGGRRFSSEQLELLMQQPVQYRIAHEFSGSSRLGATSDLTDGGFGISPRVVNELFAEMLNYKPDSDLTVRDVTDFLISREGNFPYYSALRQMRAKVQKQIYIDECERRNINPLDPATLDSSGLGKDERDKIKSAWAEAVKLTNERFPIAEPKDIIREIERHAKGLVREDILVGLGLTEQSLHERFSRYIVHLSAYLVKGRDVPEEYRVVSKKFSESGKDERGISLPFMESVELDMTPGAKGRDSRLSPDAAMRLRQEIFTAFSGGSSDIQRRHELAGSEMPATHEIIAELIKSKATLTDKLKILHEKMGNEAEPRLEGILGSMRRYQEQPGKLETDLNDPQHRENAQQWRAMWEHMTSLGYTERTLPGLIEWSLKKTGT